MLYGKRTTLAYGGGGDSFAEVDDDLPSEDSNLQHAVRRPQVPLLSKFVLVLIGTLLGLALGFVMGRPFFANIFATHFDAFALRGGIVQAHPHCTRVEAIRVANAFFKAGGPATTICPSNEMFNSVVRNEKSCRTIHNVLVVGGNKGYDCVGWARFIAGNRNTSISEKRWMQRLRAYLNKKGRSNITLTGSCVDTLAEGEAGHGKSNNEAYPPLAANGGVAGHVYCVEPMPINVELIRVALNTHDAPWNVPTPRITVIPAAVSSAEGMPASGFFKFHNDPKNPGREDVGIAKLDYQSNLPFVEVRATTVDAIVSEHLAKGQTINVLTVDTEGNDPNVLLGASKTLAKGTIDYIQFEVHDHGAWATTTVKSVVDYLETFDYDCFWVTDAKEHVAYLVSGSCWDARYDAHKEWSNMVCARRETCWHRSLMDQFERWAVSR